MGQTLYIPDATALSGVEPHRRFVCLVVLLATRDGADRVRFETRPDGWGVFAGRPDGTEEEYVPVAAEAAVDRTVRALARPGWAGRVRALFGATPALPVFDVQLGRGTSVRCRVTEGEGGVRLALEQSGEAAVRAGGVAEEYWRVRGL
jgi:hypothetical protein